MCRTALIRSALELSDFGASNGASSLQIRHFGADMADFEVAGWPRISNLVLQIVWLRFAIMGHSAISKAAMSAPECRIYKFCPPFDVPGSGLSSALRIIAVRHTYDHVATIFWTLDKNCRFINVWNVICLTSFFVQNSNYWLIFKSIHAWCSSGFGIRDRGRRFL